MSYKYNAVCDVCGFQFKASELRRRWDGHMVCQKDYEIRNILDLYKPRNDTHKLPFTRPAPASDSTGGPVWTFSVETNIADSAGSHTTTASYWADTLNRILHYTIQVDHTTTNPSDGSYTLASNPIFTGLPTGYTFSTDRGGIGTLSSTGQTGVVSMPGGTTFYLEAVMYIYLNRPLIMRGSYLYV